MQDINNISNIEELLCFFDYFIKNGHSITIIWVKFTLNISSDLSQKIMNYYFQKRKEELCVTYLVEGYINNGDEYTYAVISENDIESKYSTKWLDIFYLHTHTFGNLQAKNNKVNFPMLWMQDLNEINKRIVSKNGIYENVSKKPKQNNTGTNDDKMNDQIKYSKIVKREKYDTNIFNEVSTGLSKNEQNNSIAKNDAQKETIKKTEINKRDEYCLFDQDIPDKNTGTSIYAKNEKNEKNDEKKMKKR
ncbi:hypothetical protein [Plasmodium yoelii yoelii]|uniref:Uncharacterized protein n=1 Tax=Plasmodium yoelii yoelii TaxID=73239 RepID=Q7RSG0_PLAYO|nr:hypothetical protein [Plasmodium yoelii yoelii]